MARATAAHWLDAGLRLLSKEGETALTLERLCTNMEKTKGSFYHHFGDMSSYLGRLLQRWRDTQTLAAIRRANTARDPRARLALLDKTVRGLDHRLDQIIRAWALRDTRAKAALEDVDQIRIGYIQELLQAEGVPQAAANLMAELEYTAFLGAQQRFPDMNTPRAKEMAATLRRALQSLVPGPGE